MVQGPTAKRWLEAGRHPDQGLRTTVDIDIMTEERHRQVADMHYSSVRCIGRWA